MLIIIICRIEGDNNIDGKHATDYVIKEIEAICLLHKGYLYRGEKCCI